MSRLIPSSVAALLFVASPASAAEATDLAAIKTQLKLMQHEYDTKIHSLEVRLARAEADAKAARVAAIKPSHAAPAAVASNATPSTGQTFDQATTQVGTPVSDAAPQDAVVVDNSPTPPSATPASNNAFNPGIAAVLNGFYLASSRDPQKQVIRGVAQGDEAGLPLRGFSLGESEVSLAANIDPYLSGFLDFSMEDDNSLSVEEAYIQSKDLPYGLTVKAGRFLSGIGYLNERHAHDWTFSDAALPYRAFLNSQYGDDGLQAGFGAGDRGDGIDQFRLALRLLDHHVFGALGRLHRVFEGALQHLAEIGRRGGAGFATALFRGVLRLFDGGAIGAGGG